MRKHADSTCSKIRKDEQAIQDLGACFIEFKCDPFDLSNISLYSLQSGIQASDTLAADFESAKNDGVQKLNSFWRKESSLRRSHCMTEFHAVNV